MIVTLFNVKIMLVDDHTLIRKGLKLIIEEVKEFKVVGESSDGEDAIRKARLINPDIVIMDINMPKLNGLEALKRMKELGIQSKFIILTAYPERANIITATKIGAKGYLLKDTNPANLIKAIREVYTGRSYIDSSAASILSNSTNKTEESSEMGKIKLLSKREYEVLVLLSEGFNNKSIGEKLFISEKTVKNHITQIYKKLEVKDRVQATIFAYDNIFR
ncbi:MAG: response regulator transcription factor [Tissierellia bacterium]|nr:response regulator transcription factor [Tissierellia bacterium]